MFFFFFGNFPQHNHPTIFTVITFVSQIQSFSDFLYSDEFSKNGYFTIYVVRIWPVFIHKILVFKPQVCCSLDEDAEFVIVVHATKF